MKNKTLFIPSMIPYKGQMIDFLTLCKPKVVFVMLVTSWVGMFFAEPQHFSWNIAFIATVGIALMGAAAAVINHLVDRKIDAKMLRTKLRPLATGRISACAATIFAGILGSMGLILLFIFVNPLTAMLTLLTLGGYAVLYTLLLKRATPQNIVIGGAAGAMPPLLGWVAMSNHIHPHALLLVLIIFLWTPPHFWSLAIYREQDYFQANIPMLPVTHGVRYTKFSILLYTLLLMMSSLLPFVVGMSGWFYLTVASILGIAFLVQTLRLYITESKRTALNTFSFSILYLLLLFLLPLCLATGLYVFQEKVSFKITASGQLQTPPILAESIGLTQSREAKGKWQLVYLCQTKNVNEELQCQAQYDLLKRIHLSLGKDQSRVYLSYSSTYPIAKEESPIKILENNTVLLIDPRGFLILQYSLPLQKPKGLLEDIRRLLRYSHVG